MTGGHRAGAPKCYQAETSRVRTLARHQFACFQEHARNCNLDDALGSLFNGKVKLFSKRFQGIASFLWL